MTRLFPAFARIAGKPRIRIRAPQPQQPLTHAVARPVLRRASPPEPQRPAVVFHDWAAI